MSELRENFPGQTAQTEVVPRPNFAESELPQLDDRQAGQVNEVASNTDHDHTAWAGPTETVPGMPQAAAIETLLAHNAELHRLLLMWGRNSQDQNVLLKEVWQRYVHEAYSKEQAALQCRGVLESNIQLQRALAQAQQACTVERVQHLETRRQIAQKNAIISAQNQELSTQREHSKVDRFF